MAFEIKRFWTAVSVEALGEGFGIKLDDRPLKTPLKRPLIVPRHALAEEIAAEWRAVEGKVDVNNMPYTRFAHAGLDQAVDEQAEIQAKIAQYGETDLLCYRADSPQELADRQAAAWDPLLEWSAQTLGAPLLLTAGIVHVRQPEASLAALKRHVAPFERFALKALYDWVTISGSLILGLAVARQRLSAAEAWDVSRVDENWQESQWGVDEEAARQAGFKRENLLMVEKYLSIR